MAAEYKPKPPRQGDGEKEYKLIDWLPKMRKYLEIVRLYDVTQLAGINVAAMNAAQRDRNARAVYCLLDNLSPLYAEMVEHHDSAADIWQALQQVSRLLLLHLLYIKKVSYEAGGAPREKVPLRKHSLYIHPIHGA